MERLPRGDSIMKYQLVLETENKVGLEDSCVG